MLVADICGSTRLYESVGDTEAYRTIADSIAALTDTISRHDGVVIKTMGDGLLSTFPSSDSAFVAADIMQQQQIGSDVAIRVGINFGTVLKNRRDVFGDSVNVAAHLVTLAKPSETVLSGDAVAHLSAGYRGQAQLFNRVRLKGKNVLTDCYHVISGGVEDTMISHAVSRIMARQPTLTLLYLGQEITVQDGGAEVRIGRDAECDLIVEGPLVSRSHATVRARQDSFYLIDHSTNGTFVHYDGEEPIVLKREPLQLHNVGAISLSADADSPDRIEFRCDFQTV